MFLSVASQHATPTCTDDGAQENTVQDQVLPLFVDFFAGCFDLPHLVAAAVVDISAGVVDL